MLLGSGIGQGKHSAGLDARATQAAPAASSLFGFDDVDEAVAHGEQEGL